MDSLTSSGFIEDLFYCEFEISAGTMSRSWNVKCFKKLAQGRTFNSNNQLTMDKLKLSVNAALKTHFSGLAFSLQQFATFYSYKALWELFLSEKSALQMPFIIDMVWYRGQLCSAARLWRSLRSGLGLSCSTLVPDKLTLCLFYGSAERKRRADPQKQRCESFVKITPPIEM